MFWLVTLLLFLAPQGFAADENGAGKWLNELLQLQGSHQKLEQFVTTSLQDYRQEVVDGTVKYPFEEILHDNGETKIVVDWANIPYGTEKKHYDHIATIWERDNNGWKKLIEVVWDSTKTGALPGPEGSLLKSASFKIESGEINEKPNHFYKGRVQFNNGPSNANGQRGYAEFFQDLQHGAMKISATVVEGPANLTWDQIKPHNVQATFGLNSYVYLIVDKNRFCKNPQGGWVSSNSREWDDFCAPLFDEGLWNGFAYTLLPKGPLMEN